MSPVVRPDARPVPDVVVRAWLNSLSVSGAALPTERFGEAATRTLRALRDGVSLVVVDPTGASVSAARLALTALESRETGRAPTEADRVVRGADTTVYDLRGLSRVASAAITTNGPGERVRIIVLDATDELAARAAQLLGGRDGTYADCIAWSEIRSRVWMPGRDEPWPDTDVAADAIATELHRIAHSSGSVSWYGRAPWAEAAVRDACRRLDQGVLPPPSVTAGLTPRLAPGTRDRVADVGECVVLGVPESLAAVASAAARRETPARVTFVAANACELALAVCARRLFAEGLVWEDDAPGEAALRLASRAMALWGEVADGLRRGLPRASLVLDTVARWAINRSNAASIVAWVAESGGADLSVPVQAADGTHRWVWWPADLARPWPLAPAVGDAVPLGFRVESARAAHIGALRDVASTSTSDLRIRSLRRALGAA